MSFYLTADDLVPGMYVALAAGAIHPRRSAAERRRAARTAGPLEAGVPVRIEEVSYPFVAATPVCPIVEGVVEPPDRVILDVRIHQLCRVEPAYVDVFRRSGTVLAEAQTAPRDRTRPGDWTFWREWRPDGTDG